MDFPILSTLIFLPLLSSFFIFLSKDKKDNISSIYISLFSSIATFLLSLFLWYSLDSSKADFQFIEEKTPPKLNLEATTSVGEDSPLSMAKVAKQYLRFISGD